MNDKIDRCTDPENCRRCSQDADTPHAGIARVRPGSDNHHAPKPEAQAAGDGVTFWLIVRNGDVEFGQDLADLLTPASHDAQQPASPAGTEAIIEAFDEISGLCRYLRQGGPAPEDLQGLSGALEEAIAIASNMLHELTQEPAAPSTAVVAVARARELLAEAERGPINDYGMVQRRTAHHAIAAALTQQPAVVGDGRVLAPARIYVQPERWEAAQFAFGGPGTGEGEPFMACTLWIGEIEGDDGSKTHGLHVSCDECPEEGSVTLAEFAALTPAATPGDGGEK